MSSSSTAPSAVPLLRWRRLEDWSRSRCISANIVYCNNFVWVDWNIFIKIILCS